MDDFLSLMLGNGEIREDLKVPESDLGEEIRKKLENGETFMVSFWGLRMGGGEIAILVAELEQL